VEGVPASTHGADAVGALSAAAVRLAAVRLPPGDLPGWSSFCAAEYRDAVRSLAVEVGAVRDALEAAIRAAAAP
jgi:hypothetical protein